MKSAVIYNVAVLHMLRIKFLGHVMAYLKWVYQMSPKMYDQNCLICIDDTSIVLNVLGNKPFCDEPHLQAITNRRILEINQIEIKTEPIQAYEFADNIAHKVAFTRFCR